MVSMPDLIDLSLRQAIALLESRGLFLGNITYQPGSFQNAVIDQIYRGQSISSGEKIRRGSYVNLVVSGTEQSNQQEEEDDDDEEDFLDEI
jgi:beta-lactam-binding protein with PASTA domain